MTQPTTKTLLAIGGPRNGQQLEEDGKVVRVMAPMPSQDPREQAAYVATAYIMRGLDGNFGGRHIRRDVYVHESVSDPQEMAMHLANILIGQYVMEGGYEIVEGDVSAGSPDVLPSGERSPAGPVGPEAPQSPSGLYIPS